MKVACKGRRNVVWTVVIRLMAGVVAILWLWRWFVRLMPRSVGGEGIYAWAELAERSYKALER